MENLVLTQQMLINIKKSLIDGLETASGSRSSATYYHSKDEQSEAIKTKVKKLYDLSKELPLIIANQKGVTGKFISEVLLNEFANTSRGGACNIINPIDWYDNGLSDKAILSALNNLGENGIPYVLRLIVDLKNNKVNNERTRKIMLGYLWGQSNLEFYSLKYRNKIAIALKHLYGERQTSILLSIAVKRMYVDASSVKENEILNDLILRYYNGNAINALKILLFIFKEDSNVDYDFNEFSFLSEYNKAKVDIFNDGAKKIPEEVLLGLISNRNHPQYESMWSTKEKRETTKALIRKNVQVTSINQQVRQTKSTEKLGVEKNVDLNKAIDFLALYKTGYENGFTDELNNAIDNLASKKKINNFFYKNIGIIVDDSASMSGNSMESKNTPKAIAEFTSKVLQYSSNKSKIVETDGFSTDLGSALVKILKMEDSNEYDAIFILTDGYENSYDGLTNEIIETFKNETGRTLPIFQISPMVSAEMNGNVRKLGNNLFTMAVNNPTAIMPQINARLLEIDTVKWLKNEFLAIESSSVCRNKKNI